MTKTEPRSAGSGGGRDKTQPTPTELLALIADLRDDAAYPGNTYDEREIYADCANRIEKIIATTLSARDDGRSVQTITMHRGDECTVRRSGGYDEHRVVWNAKAATAGDGK